MAGLSEKENYRQRERLLSSKLAERKNSKGTVISGTRPTRPYFLRWMHTPKPLNCLLITPSIILNYATKYLNFLHYVSIGRGF